MAKTAEEWAAEFAPCYCQPERGMDPDVHDDECPVTLRGIIIRALLAFATQEAKAEADRRAERIAEWCRQSATMTRLDAKSAKSAETEELHRQRAVGFDLSEAFARSTITAPAEEEKSS